MIFVLYSHSSAPNGCAVDIQKVCYFEISQSRHIGAENVIFVLRQIHPFDERINCGIIVAGFVVNKSYVRRCNAVVYGGCVRQMASELLVQVSVGRTEARSFNRYNVLTSGRIIVAKFFTDVFAKEKY